MAYRMDTKMDSLTLLYIVLSLMLSYVSGQQIMDRPPVPVNENSDCPNVEEMYPGLQECEERSICLKDGINMWKDTKDLDGVGLSFRNCYCDALCRVYGDCCEDIVQLMSTGTDPWADTQAWSARALYQDTVSCVTKTRGLKVGAKAVWMVTQCPADWEDEAVREQCQLTDFTPSDDDTFLKWPVSDHWGVLYKNMYCAICNQQPDFKYWNIEVKCSDLMAEMFKGSREEFRKLLKQKLASGQCKLTFNPPTNGTDYRPCKTVIDTCSQDWQDTCDTRDKCENGNNSFVYQDSFSQVTVAYKNKYCAACNNEVDAVCMDKLPLLMSGTRSFFPLSIIFDVNTGSGKVTGYDVGHVAGSLINETVSEVKSCTVDQVYDPFKDICRTLSCRSGFILNKGQCVPTFREDSSLDIISKPDCLRVRLNNTEYMIFDNGSLFIIESSEMHTSGSYELESDGSALICTNFTQNYTVTTLYLKHEVNLKFSSAQTILSVVGQIISMLGLFIHLVVYTLFPKLRNLAGKNLMCLSAALFCGQFFFLVGGSAMNEYIACAILAILTHYFFVASFGWMNVMAFDIWKTFAKTSKPSAIGNHTKKFMRYCLYAWGGSFIIILVATVVNFSTTETVYRPGYGENICWLRYRPALLIFFALPVAIVILVNLVLYVLTCISIYKISKMAKLVTNKADKSRLWLYIKLSSIMGLTWIFGFVAAIFDSETLWYFFIIFNSLQGAFICVSFVFTKQVLGLVRERSRSVYQRVSSTFPSSSTSESQTRSTAVFSGNVTSDMESMEPLNSDGKAQSYQISQA